MGEQIKAVAAELAVTGAVVVTETIVIETCDVANRVTEIEIGTHAIETLRIEAVEIEMCVSVMPAIATRATETDGTEIIATVIEIGIAIATGIAIVTAGGTK